MVANPKPGVDWARIRERLARGDLASEISAADYAPSAVMIRRKAKQLGWPVVDGRGAHRSKTKPSKTKPLKTKLRVAADLPNADGVALDHVNGINREKAAEVLRLLADGRNISGACGLVSLDPATLWRWTARSPEFKHQVQQAQWINVARNESNIQAAADRGDWKASQAILRAQRLSRERWSDDTRDQSPASTLNVQFFATKQSAPRADLIAAGVIEVDVIDVEAEPIETQTDTNTHDDGE